MSPLSWRRSPLHQKDLNIDPPGTKKLTNLDAFRAPQLDKKHDCKKDLQQYISCFKWAPKTVPKTIAKGVHFGAISASVANEIRAPA